MSLAIFLGQFCYKYLLFFLYSHLSLQIILSQKDKWKLEDDPLGQGLQGSSSGKGIFDFPPLNKGRASVARVGLIFLTCKSPIPPEFRGQT